MPEFLVLKHDFQRGRGTWTEVERAEAPDAGSAFRAVVTPPNVVLPTAVVGEYLVLPLEGSAHLGVELNLRDLTAPSNPTTGDDRG